MDPKACLERIDMSVDDGEWAEAAWACSDLLRWYFKGGGVMSRAEMAAVIVAMERIGSRLDSMAE